MLLGTPTDPLQYLSQLELVARKLKDQLIKQKQVLDKNNNNNNNNKNDNNNNNIDNDDNNDKVVY